jgi:hypothetical protein
MNKGPHSFWTKFRKAGYSVARVPVHSSVKPSYRRRQLNAPPRTVPLPLAVPAAPRQARQQRRTTAEVSFFLW